MNKKLKARLAAIQQECKTLVSAADESHEGVMPEVDQKTFDGLMVEAENIQGQIERNQSMADLNQSMDETDGRQVPAQSGSAPAYSRNNSQDDENMGFQNMGEFATVVQQSCDFGVAQDSRLSVLGSAAPGSPHREGGSSEGYLVPPAMRREIWQLVYGDDDSLLNDVDHEPTASNSVSFVKDQT
ncbi:MAG: phage major capsid protein, partial [Colwellia sp.]|nr:phage major capsid protein [Colwellia sp.]